MLVPISSIKINLDRQNLTKSSVKKLADSMKDVSLINPITLDQQYTLIAGLHRLEAAKLLVWTEIECSIATLEGMQAALAQLDEKLMRSDLSHLDQCDAMYQRKALYEALHPKTKNGGNKNVNRTRTQNLRSGEAKPFRIFPVIWTGSIIRFLPNWIGIKSTIYDSVWIVSLPPRTNSINMLQEKTDCPLDRQKASQWDAQPAPFWGCSKGLGKIFPTSKCVLPLWAGEQIFALQVPQCPACEFCTELNMITKTGRCSKRENLFAFIISD